MRGTAAALAGCSCRSGRAPAASGSAGSCSAMSFCSRLRLATAMSIRLASALRTAASRSIGSARRRRPVGRLDRRVPQLVVGAADDQALQRELVGAARRLRGAPAPGGGWLLRPAPGRRRSAPSCRSPPGRGCPAPAWSRARASAAPPRRCRSRRPDPSRRCGPAASVIVSVDAQVEIGDLRLQLADQQVRPGLIDLEVPQQRLRVLRLEVRRERRIAQSRWTASSRAGCC